MTNEEDPGFVLADWTPPWIDDGKSLKAIIEKAQGKDLQFNGWLFLSLFLSRQIEFDLNRVKKQTLNEKT